MRLARPSRVRRLAAPLLAFCSAAAIAACSNEPTAAGDAPGGRAPDTLTALPRALTQGEQQAIEIGNEFSFRLLREVNARKLNENVFISPFSAAMALGMTTNGAAGETEAAMRRTLGFGTRSLQQMNDAYRGPTPSGIARSSPSSRRSSTSRVATTRRTCAPRTSRIPPRSRRSTRGPRRRRAGRSRPSSTASRRGT
jgi:hypothetical protein